ncbi:MAG: UDP-N-acetylmuramoyl-L-alanyl-D-glutamate--2,6-diaminopimelate ligase [Planctomycetaceae bacterium]|nr:UDP-N-acetylmuramoyl-L-alanyl-D-glutamate--2,6-diaminopimelate ligase [Planctomycetaceae bacterium]MCB9950425.1 UDP-N-acetylmuramoyl-L-alanyl-D-glutamate--2,6-diaminopimelate ligase [Planctomycetaceae bacterium]
MGYPPSTTGIISLKALLPSARFVNCHDITVADVTEKSCDVRPGCLFAALPGTRIHGRDFVPEALRSGAAAILTDRSLAGHSVPHCIVADARRAYGELCHALHFHPAQRLKMVGVTGTNGKTTTTWLVRELLQQLGKRCGLLGTIQYSDGNLSAPSSLTTPDARQLAGWLGSMVAQKARHAAMEISSHALDQQRIAGVSLDVAIVTNVTQDHLDYHQTFDDYVRAKAGIANYLKPQGILLINADDPGCRGMAANGELPAKCQTFGIAADADYRGTIEEETLQGTRFTLHVGETSVPMFLPMPGRHNVENALAAIAAVHHQGFPLEEIVHALAHCQDVPGRLQHVECASAATVLVDFAHTPDALGRVISTLRQLTFGRVIVVFGAGGNRDQSKRPQMGKVASQADLAIITSDNPRSEDPAEIAAHIQRGMEAGQCRVEVELDRRAAILRALEIAEEGDTVLIAGKGHEQTQIVGSRSIEFNDVAVCRSMGERQLIVSKPLQD